MTRFDEIEKTLAAGKSVCWDDFLYAMKERDKRNKLVIDETDETDETDDHCSGVSGCES